MEIRTAAPVQYTPSSPLLKTVDAIRLRSAKVFLQVKFFGYSRTMDDYESRKLRIFNQLNFFQALSGLFIPLLGIVLPDTIPAADWVTCCLPALVSIAVLGLTYFKKYKASLVTYFICYPFCTAVVYLGGVNPGTDLYFILFVVLAIFFLQNLYFMLFTIGLSVVSFFILSVVLTRFVYTAAADSPLIYLLNKLTSLAFIVYGLLLVKKENSVYQYNMLARQKRLAGKNLEIKKQKEALAELNDFKSKMFSIIAHDLKSPMYALRNLFQSMHQYNLPSQEVKDMVPHVLVDLNYTTALMENLLQWAKSQMQNDAVNTKALYIDQLIADVVKLLRLQIESKKLTVQVAITDKVLVYTDKDMIHLVLRNLLSNAIKFTPPGGRIEIGFTDFAEAAEVYIQDSGTGISAEALEKIKQKSFYTTTGTAKETGTGLGLMLCTEFLAKNNSRLQIESTPGEGSIFSFLLPKELGVGS